MDLRNPTVRWALGLSGSVAIAAVALLYLEGTVRNVALGVAVIDAVTTPWILKQAAEG